MNYFSFRAVFVLIASAAIFSSRLVADESDEIKDIRAQIQVLEQKLQDLEHKQQQKEQAAAEAAKTEPKVTVDDNGLKITSADKSSAVHLGALMQFDSRLFFSDGGGIQNNSFLLRRARILFDGTLDKIYSFQFVPEFGGTSAPIIYDANFGAVLAPEAQLKFGKFKPPLGMESLQLDSATLFAERSLANNLFPTRDVGAQIAGNLNEGVFTYTAGIFNGVADGTVSPNADLDNDKDVSARLIFRPFQKTKDSALQGLSFGAAGDFGREKGTASAPNLTAGYKTDGQQTFFKYNSAVVADGPAWRYTPQAYYAWGPFSALSEYVISTVNVRAAGGPRTELRNKAWQVAAGYVLTGEDAAYGGVAPAHPFDWDNGTWGALQLTARYADLKIDPNAFPTFADATVNAKQASAIGLGVNWFPNKMARVSLDYFQTHFTNSIDSSSATQILRQDEKALISRFQLAF